jgi:hypothetical protein
MWPALWDLISTFGQERKTLKIWWITKSGASFTALLIKLQITFVQKKI